MKMNKICWILISFILLIIFLPVVAIIGFIMVISIYIQIIKDFWNYNEDNINKIGNDQNSKNTGLYQENY